MIYLWTKTLHLLFVVAWLAAVFYLPRILVNVAEAAGQGEVRARLYLMGRRLYRFGHNMFGLAVLLGALLWFGHRGWPALWPNVVTGGWLHAKLGLVVVLLVLVLDGVQRRQRRRRKVGLVWPRLRLCVPRSSRAGERRGTKT